MPDGSFNITKTNLDILIAHLEEVQAAPETGWQDPVTGNRARFFMGAWCGDEDECGTPACVAGHAALLADPVRFWSNAGPVDEAIWPFRSMISFVAARWLGLDHWTADQLFHGADKNGAVSFFENITLPEAIETLRRLRATGQVDWSHAERYQGRAEKLADFIMRGWNPNRVLVDMIPSGE